MACASAMVANCSLSIFSLWSAQDTASSQRVLMMLIQCLMVAERKHKLFLVRKHNFFYRIFFFSDNKFFFFLRKSHLSVCWWCWSSALWWLRMEAYIYIYERFCYRKRKNFVKMFFFLLFVKEITYIIMLIQCLMVAVCWRIKCINNMKYNMNNMSY